MLHMTVHQLLTNMDSTELTEWRAFLEAEQELEEEARQQKVVDQVQGFFSGRK